MLVLCPTRELSKQVGEELSEIAQPLGLVTSFFHGGVSYDPQIRALRQGIDVLVGTPGRIIDHISRRSLSLKDCDIVVLDEADEMLNMGFAQDVDVILEDVGISNDAKTQCLLFSATTPSWVSNIARKYQGSNVLSIDATSNKGARTATTIRHIAIQVPPDFESKKAILEDIIAVEISKDMANTGSCELKEQVKAPLGDNLVEAAVTNKNLLSLQQKIFGKTIVFTETKRDADELVSGNVFKSLTAQSIHGDVSQKQRDTTLSAFRSGAFNVLVATDVAARGIDIKNVDLVIQFAPPRDNDTYVHRSGRTGRAGEKGTSVLLFDIRQTRDVVRIERGLGHGFKFEIKGPPSSEAALNATAKTAAIACRSVPDDKAMYFLDAATSLLIESKASPEMIVAKCLATMSRRSSISLESRSLLTGETGMITLEMSKNTGKPVLPGDVMFTISQLSRRSRGDEAMAFDNNIGKIQRNHQTGVVLFDMNVVDAKKLIQFSRDKDSGGSNFRILKELELERENIFGSTDNHSNRKGERGRGTRRRYRSEKHEVWGYNKSSGRNDRFSGDYNRRDHYYKNLSRSTYHNKSDTKGRRYNKDGW